MQIRTWGFIGHPVIPLPRYLGAGPAAGLGINGTVDPPRQSR